MIPIPDIGACIKIYIKKYKNFLESTLFRRES
jgi:hypothetical protein